MSSEAPRSVIADSPDSDGSPDFWPPRSLFYRGLLVAGALVATVIAAQANVDFLVLGAFIAAGVLDGFDPFSSVWVGWKRPVDPRRVLFFMASFVFALVILASVAFVIENRIYTSGA